MNKLMPPSVPRYYILKCRVHGGEIYALEKTDNICGRCYDERKKKKSN